MFSRAGLSFARRVKRAGWSSVLGRGFLCGALVGVWVFVGVSPVLAVEPASHLVIHTDQFPTRFSEADEAGCEQWVAEGNEIADAAPCDYVQVRVTNSGSLPLAGPIVVHDTLPAGVSAIGARFFWATNPLDKLDTLEEESSEGSQIGEWPAGGLPIACTIEGEPQTVSCQFGPGEVYGHEEQLKMDDRLELDIHVTAKGAVAGQQNKASVYSSGVLAASTEEPDLISDEFPPWGARAIRAPSVAADGQPDTQAGDHPSGLTTTLIPNTIMQSDPESLRVVPTSVTTPRDVVVDLPLGFLGSAIAAPKCTYAQLQIAVTSCPKDTRVGHLVTEPTGEDGVNSSLYNMVPKEGHVAEFGFTDILHHTHAIVATIAPTPSGYVTRAIAKEIPSVPLADVISDIFGDPSQANEEELPQVPMFTNPADCSGEPLTAKLYMDSWKSPGTFNADGTPEPEGAGWPSVTYESPPVTGCDLLHFEAAMSAKPDTSAGDSPTGLDFDLTVPQTEEPGKLATPPLRDATVAMSPGMTVDPSSATGLEACSESEIGWKGGTLSNFTEAAPSCPEASRVGTVEVTTPLLEKPVVGSVYLATQNENPFNALLAAYIVIDDPATGTIVKVPGRLETNPETGQITGRFDENPQVPFDEFKLRFFGGSRGELATPQSCGTFTTSSDLMPWSAPDSGPDATPSSSYSINSNCALGFSPSFSAGTTTNQAGAFTPLTLTIAREDGEQHLTGLTVTTPPGLLGVLKSVVQCPEPQASEGACGPESLIGETTISSGVGPDPFVVKGGRVYLTGPYNGGPFGLSIVVPAIAGPFNLGNVLTRSSIRINPVTAQVTVVSDPLPLMVNSEEGLKSGIPSDIRTVNVTINRPGFEFNPTNCSPMSITGTLTGAQGATVPVSSSFQAANCANLPFHPSFAAATDGKASKANGAAFIVKVAAKPGEANIAKTDLTIPALLPSRLTTIQKACLDSVFEANPASCDEGSVIGTATVHSPDIKSPLTGPAYLVSHGGAAFPDVEFVLQGEGIELILDGHTDIKKGVTYSRFETLPDAPIETFETVLPTGPHSALTANVPEKLNFNLCGQNIQMPTTIVAQNGAVINETTKVAVNGCPNKLTILSHHINRRTITLTLTTPSAGTLTATGKHLTKAKHTTHQAETITITLKTTTPNKPKTSTIKLTFSPTNHTPTLHTTTTIKH
jgi:hypothetical protein